MFYARLLTDKLWRIHGCMHCAMPPMPASPVSSCSLPCSPAFSSASRYTLQSVIDNCGKNYPTMKKIKTLFSQMYDYAMKNEICNKDYSGFVNILQYKDRKPDKRDRDKFTKDEIARVWTMQEDPYYQIILMLLYSGVRINIFTNLLSITRVPGAESPGNTVFLLRVHRTRTDYFFSYRILRRLSISRCNRRFSSSSFAIRLSFAAISTSLVFDVRSYFLCHAPALAASIERWDSISFRIISFL